MHTISAVKFTTARREYEYVFTCHIIRFFFADALTRAVITLNTNDLTFNTADADVVGGRCSTLCFSLLGHNQDFRLAAQSMLSLLTCEGSDNNGV